MSKLGVFSICGFLLLVHVSDASARDAFGAYAIGTDDHEAQLRYDAARKGIVLTHEALDSYLALKARAGSTGETGSAAGDGLGGAIGGTMSRGSHAGIDAGPSRSADQAVRASIGDFLDGLANIRIRVRPSPPRDYIVMINGRSYPASEKSVYALPPSVVQISVSRKGKPPCQWVGAVDTNRDKILDCRL